MEYIQTNFLLLDDESLINIEERTNKEDGGETEENVQTEET